MSKHSIKFSGVIAFSIAAIAQATPAICDELVVASFGGQLGVAIEAAAKPYIEANGLTVHWVPGTANENVAKVIATRENPEYDIALMENLTFATLLDKDVLATVGAANLEAYKDLVPAATALGEFGLPLGIFYTGLFYNSAEFEKRGWVAPTSWSDIFRPELCEYVGIQSPSVIYGLSPLIMLGDKTADGVGQGIERVAELKDCISTLETNAAKFEEKIQLGEYLIGANGTIRTAPLMNNGYPLKYVSPVEGSVISYTTAVVPKFGKNVDAARGLLNYLISSEAQHVLMEMAYYAPVNKDVEFSEQLKEFGVPTADQTDQIVIVDSSVIVERRRDWVRQLERAIAR